MNKICWVKNCQEFQNKSKWICDKHERMSLKGYMLEMDSPTLAKSNAELNKEQRLEKRLNQTVREGKSHGKNINKLRSKMKNKEWHYEYIK